MVYERICAKQVALAYVKTNEQAADIMTKGITKAETWWCNMALINQVVPHNFWALRNTRGVLRRLRLLPILHFHSTA